MAKPGLEPRSFHCPSKYCNHNATEADCHCILICVYAEFAMLYNYYLFIYLFASCKSFIGYNDDSMLTFSALTLLVG